MQLTNAARRTLAALAALALLLGCLPALAEMKPLSLEEVAQAPAEQYYTSDTHYEDPSLTVDIGEGRIHETNYVYAVIKIADASQIRTALCIRANRRSNHIRGSELFFQYFRRTKPDRRYHQIHLCFSCLQKCIQFISHCPGRQHLPSTGFQVLFQHLYMRYRSKVQWCHTKQIDGACLNPSCLFPGKSFRDLL